MQWVGPIQDLEAEFDAIVGKEGDQVKDSVGIILKQVPGTGVTKSTL